MRKWALAALAALSMAAVAFAPSAARPWKPQPSGLAQDYAQIVDVRPNHDIVLLMWLVPPLVQNSPTTQDLLDKYVIVGVVHGHIDAGGTMAFDTLDSLTAQDADGKPLTLLQNDKIPPTVSGLITGMGGMMRQNLGALGQGMYFFAFDGGAVHACSKGRLSIPFAGEVYTYDTPIPGCPPQQ